MIMKLRGLGAAAGIAIIAGVLYAGIEGDRRDRDRDRVRQMCTHIGEVAQDCDRIMPDVRTCLHEDCSDITGMVGFWRDPHDGRLYLTRAAWTVRADQSAAETAG
jgi:hypothetical protein